jgi:hypothetical protein
MKNKPKMFEKDGCQGIWRPERKLLDLYGLTDGKAHMFGSIPARNAVEARELFDKAPVYQPPTNI